METFRPFIETVGSLLDALGVALNRAGPRLCAVAVPRRADHPGRLQGAASEYRPRHPARLEVLLAPIKLVLYHRVERLAASTRSSTIAAISASPFSAVASVGSPKLPLAL